MVTKNKPTVKRQTGAATKKGRPAGAADDKVATLSLRMSREDARLLQRRAKASLMEPDEYLICLVRQEAATSLSEDWRAQVWQLFDHGWSAFSIWQSWLTEHPDSTHTLEYFQKEEQLWAQALWAREPASEEAALSKGQ